MEGLPDKIQYTLNLNNTNSFGIPCVFTRAVDRIFLPNNMTDYNMTIIGMSVSTFDIPIFTYNNTDKVSVSYTDAVFGEIFAVPTVIPFISRDRNGDRKIYQMSQYIEMINAGMYSAFVDLDFQCVTETGNHLPGYAVGPPASWTTQPKVYYDKLTERMSIKASAAYFQDTLTAGFFTIYLNRYAFTRISGIDNFTTGIIDKEFRVIFHDNGDNITAGVITNMQQNSGFNEMTDFVSIQVTTRLPVQRLYSDQGNINSIALELSQHEFTMRAYQETLIYDAVVPYKTLDIASPIQMTDMTFSVYYTTINNETIALKVPPNSNSFIKLLFSKKSMSNF